MPGRHQQPSTADGLCRRCHEQEPAITVRTEPLCKECFAKYTQTKVVKRLETFRVRNTDPGIERTLLLPLSFGPCSTALLHILSRHRKGQAEKARRTGFQLHILHVRQSTEQSDSLDEELLEKVKQRYPEHHYSTLDLSDIFQHPSLLQSDLFLTPLIDQTNASNAEKLAHFLSSLPSPTSRTDTAEILLRKLIVHHALANSCSAVVWGSSTTRLAERTLAETAKGRGFALPWMIADGESPFQIPFYYPMRDLLSKEIAAYVGFLNPSLEDLVVVGETKPTVSAKNATIDGLMRQYFESVELEYPSIVANVVRTTGKLQAKSLSDVEAQCELCEMPLEGQAPERSRLCYGCIRTLPHVAG